MIGTLVPIGLCVIVNSVLNGYIAGTDSAVLRSGPIGECWVQSTIEEYSWMIPLVPLPSKKLRNSSNEGRHPEE